VQRRVTLREECHQSRMHGEERQTTDVLAMMLFYDVCLEATVVLYIFFFMTLCSRLV
jgi:hypothetical protein